jgi:hypothetical protein
MIHLAFFPDDMKDSFNCVSNEKLKRVSFHHSFYNGVYRLKEVFDVLPFSLLH